jgi:hypothetical protein
MHYREQVGVIALLWWMARSASQGNVILNARSFALWKELVFLGEKDIIFF